MTKAQKISATLACVAALLTGSMTAMAKSDGGCTLSDTEPATAPKIAGNRNDSKRWDNPGLFTKIPDAQKQERGDATCRAAGYEQACGYHSKAQDVNGIEFPGGGYLCSGTRTQNEQIH